MKEEEKTQQAEKQPENALVVQIKQLQLEPETEKSLQEHFLPFYEQAIEWKNKAESLVVTDISEIDKMTQAREARLILKNIRTSVEKTRKILKEDYKKMCDAIDGIARVLKTLIEPIEDHLEKQEKFVEIQENNRRIALKAEREALLIPLDVDPMFYDLANMPDETFAKLLENSKTNHANKLIAEQKAEEERIANEKAAEQERERIRLENERLRKENEERETKAAEEKRIKDEQAAKLKEITDKRCKELSDLDMRFNGQEYFFKDVNIHWTEISTLNDLEWQGKLSEIKPIIEQRKQEQQKADEEENKRLQKEAADKALKDAELKRQKEEKEKADAELKQQKEAEKKAKRLPDKEKLINFANSINEILTISSNVFKSDEANEIFNNYSTKILKATNDLLKEAKEL